MKSATQILLNGIQHYLCSTTEKESVNKETSSVISTVRDAAKQVVSSLLWIPEGAGQPIVAADISEQTEIFKTNEGEITLTCVWGGQSGDEPAYIWLKWEADIKPDTEFFATDLWKGNYLYLDMSALNCNEMQTEK
ncbi:MAG: hypothetical protein GY749_38925 [Desulfobacteraceae bacterium]|nr:hypothetical protein [Desulfobacteraceae bacterium]